MKNWLRKLFGLKRGNIYLGATIVWGVPKGVEANKEYQVVFKPDECMTITDGDKSFTLALNRDRGNAGWEIGYPSPPATDEERKERLRKFAWDEWEKSTAPAKE